MGKHTAWKGVSPVPRVKEDQTIWLRHVVLGRVGRLQLLPPGTPSIFGR